MPNAMFAVDYSIRPDGSPSGMPLVHKLCDVARLKLYRVTQTSEVWVARLNGRKTPLPSTSTPSCFSPAKGVVRCRGLEVRKILSQLEDAFGVSIEDATGLAGTFDADIGTAQNFDAARCFLEDDTGIALKKEVRKIDFYRVARALESTSRAADHAQVPSTQPAD